MNKDLGGTNYNSPNGKPASNGVPVQIPDGNGGSNSGTMQNGYVVPNKK